MHRLVLSSLWVGMLLMGMLLIANQTPGQFKPSKTPPRSIFDTAQKPVTPRSIADTAQKPKLLGNSTPGRVVTNNNNNNTNTGNRNIVIPNLFPPKLPQNNGTTTIYGQNNGARLFTGGNNVVPNRNTGSTTTPLNLQGGTTNPSNQGNNNNGTFQGGTQDADEQLPVEIGHMRVGGRWRAVPTPTTDRERRELLRGIAETLPDNSLVRQSMERAARGEETEQDVRRIQEYMRNAGNASDAQLGAMWATVKTWSLAPQTTATDQVLGQSAQGNPTGGQNNGTAVAITNLLANLANLAAQAANNNALNNGGNNLVIVDPGIGLVPSALIEEPPVENNQVETQNLPNDIQKFDHAFLRVRNATGEKLAVFVQYYTFSSKAQAWKWFPKDPSKEEAVGYRLNPGEEIDIYDGDWRLNAAKVRIWAQSASGRPYFDYLSRDLWLVPLTNGERCYYSNSGETFLFTFNPRQNEQFQTALNNLNKAGNQNNNNAGNNNNSNNNSGGNNNGGANNLGTGQTPSGSGNGSGSGSGSGSGRSINRN